MAKWKRRVVGSVLKSKPDKEGNPQPSYIAFNPQTQAELAKALMMAGDEKLTLKLESKKMQSESLEKAVSENKIGGENAEKARARIDKIPDFVLFELVLLTKEV